MNSHNCQIYQDQFAELLEASAGAIVRAEFERHIVDCAACQSAWRAYTCLSDDLEALGAIHRRSLPPVDLTAAVMRELDQLKSGMHALSALEHETQTDHTSAQVYAALEGSLDEVNAARWRRRVEAEPALAQEIDQLRDLHAGLESAAQEFYAALPRIDIVDAVLRRAASLSAPHSELSTPQTPEMRFTPVMEAALENEPGEEFTAFCAAHPGLRDEYEALCRVKADLFALGAEAAARVPSIDIVDSVMSAVSRTRALPPNTSPVFPRKQSPRKPGCTGRYPWRGRALAAMAAVVLVGFAFAVFSILGRPENPLRLASKSHDGTSTLKRPSAHQESLFKAVTPVAPLILKDTAAASPPEEPAHHTNEITFQQALETRRAAMLKDADALMRLGQWASLAPEEARALLENSGLSPEAIVGASQFLPPEEAAVVLRAAVQNNPENPYLRFALAQNLMSTPTGQDEAREQLAAWGELDPDNAMPHFMDANLLLASGNAGDAMNCLQDASSRSSANTYALIAARCQREALIANGMDPEVAKLVAASTAGISEAERITDVGNQLLAYGRQYESAGDYETAALIYEAMQQLGMQVDASAVMASERSAGLNTALQAISALEQIYQILQEPDSLQVLAALSDSLAAGFDQVNTLVNEYNALLNTGNQEAINQFLDLVLTYGDLHVNE